VSGFLTQLGGYTVPFKVDMTSHVYKYHVCSNALSYQSDTPCVNWSEWGEGWWLL